MTLRVYNTLTRQKESFETVRPGNVGMYVCGPTVYKPSHIGHMVGPVIFDTVKRYLVYNGYEVKLVINITDVDDKLIVESQKQKTTVPELAERVTADYVQNLKTLSVTGIDAMPRATQHIGDILSMIQGLIDKGFAYPAAGDVYFDVSKDEDYGKLCHRDPEQMEAGARIEVSDRKKNPGDFALWKSAKPGEPQWESPWGPGRPGWHIECSAMTMKLLGTTLDIHGGGLDLQFPHHENELAQSESFSGKTFVRYWMHNGLMKTGEAKMSKSKGNEIVVAELLKRHDAATLRFFLLSTHYRRPIDYSEERLQETRRALDGFYRFFERCGRIGKIAFHEMQGPQKRAPFDQGEELPKFLQEVRKLRGKFLSDMDDDFNTGGAIGVMFELLTALNRFADEKGLEGPKAETADIASFKRGLLTLKEMGNILGIFEQPLATKQDSSGSIEPAALAKIIIDLGQTAPSQNIEELMQQLIVMRAEARKVKNFAVADQVRQRLTQLGITLEDRPGGTGWRAG